MRQNNKSNAIEKALQILLAFKPYNRELGTSELSQKLDFHKATTSRILQTLTEHGFLRQNPHTKKFSLGHVVHELGLALDQSLSNNFVQMAIVHLDELRDTLDETIVLEVWSGDNIVIAHISENTRPVRVVGRVGDRLPFYAAAGAKAILSFAKPESLEPLLQQEFKPYTPMTVTEPQVLKAQLAKFKQQGYAVDNEEVDLGISAIGVPIFNHQHHPVAAAVVVTPTQRLADSPDSKTVVSLKRTAKAISENLFYQDYDPSSMKGDHND